MELIYLAIPYSKYEEASYELANQFTVFLLKQGKNVFSPITHSHSLKKYGVPGNWEFWKKIDYHFLTKCDSIYVIIPPFGGGIKSVEESTGVQAEIEYAQEIGLSIFYVDASTKKIYSEEEFLNLSK